MFGESEDYGIVYQKYQNKITIVLPPTEETAWITSTKIVDRRTDITSSELLLILMLVEKIFRKDDEE